jgi:3-methyladenine DNA glycosylase AlkC
VKDKKTPLMKDSLGPAAIGRLAAALAAADPDFPAATFRRKARAGLENLELKERVAHVIGTLDVCLPADYGKALALVRRAGDGFPASDPVGAPDGFAAWPLIDWVGTRGLDHFDASLAALRGLTGLFSAEFAVRPFLIANPERALTHFHRWTRDPDEHVRRLASEGSRPRLPWGRQLPMFREDPAPVLALLEHLKDDPAEYVRRSVANNLNDIAKDHPAETVRVCRRWIKGAPVPRSRLVRHALRTLVKQGDPAALKVLGFTTRPEVAAELILTASAVCIGDTLDFAVRLASRSRRAQKLVVDYALHLCRANGRMGRKVFKLRTLDLAGGQTVVLRKSQSFAPRSVRRYYPGRHRIELLVGGRSLAEAFFEVTG